MKTGRTLLITICIVEFMMIAYLLYDNNKAAMYTTRDAKSVSLDSMKAIEQKDSLQDRSLLIEFMTTSKVNLDLLNIPSFGECKKASSFGGTIPANVLQVDVTVKGSNLLVQQYLLDNLDYTSKPGCFVTRPTAHSMSNFISYNRTDSILPFLLNLRSDGVRNNDFEYSVIVKDNKGTTIGKFPKDAESLKGKISFIKYPIIINDTIQLKKAK